MGNKIKAVILAAGKSTRTYPLTLNKHKCMLKIANIRLIEHTLMQLDGLVDEAVIVVNHFKDDIINFLGSKWNGIKITYAEQKKTLGTAHALSMAKNSVKGKFIVMGGDDLFFKDDIEECIRNYPSAGGYKVEDPSVFGVFKLEKNKIRKIVEKPKEFISDIANIGLYVLDDYIFECISNIKKSERGEYEITDALQLFADEKGLNCVIVKQWIPLTFPWNLLKANKIMVDYHIKNIQLSKVDVGANLKDKVYIGNNTVVKSGAYIEGPVIVGENCFIGPNCHLRAYTVIGNNCVIGNAVEIKNSVIGDKTNIGHLSYVGDSVIGNNVNFGAGTKIANLRHDKSSISCIIKNKKIDTSLKKLGAIIGDNVSLGINTSILPGRMIWPNSTTYPGEIVKKNIVNE